MSETKRVGIYARVSTADQTAENQLLDLRGYCASRGWSITEEFIDSGISGAKEDRPALRRLMEAVRRRRVDCVLVWRFDRFARSSSHLVAALEELRGCGVEFASYQEGIDTATPIGKCLFTISAAFAELERNLIQERVRAGLRRARAAGIPLGRPRRSIDMAKAHQLRAQGRSLREIGAELGLPASIIFRVFQKPSQDFVAYSVEEVSGK